MEDVFDRHTLRATPQVVSSKNSECSFILSQLAKDVYVFAQHCCVCLFPLGAENFLPVKKGLSDSMLHGHPAHAEMVLNFLNE